MLSALAALSVLTFAPSQPWALGLAAPPRIPFVGDVDGDGLADLIVVYPEGDSIVDVSLNVEGAKAGAGFQALPRWAGRCGGATVGEFDGQKGADVAGLFGTQIKVAGGFQGGRFRSLVEGPTLPKPLDRPALATVGGRLLAYSTTSGAAYRIDVAAKTAIPVRVPKGLVWIGGIGEVAAAQDRDGNVFRLDPESLAKIGKLGKESKGSRPAVGRGWIAFDNVLWTVGGTPPPPSGSLPPADTVRAGGDIDGDGDDDLIEFRYGKEAHTGNEILVRRCVSAEETDSDHDGLSNAEEARLGTDPRDPDTDHDGLLDGWEVKGFRGLDLPKLGCDPRHADLLCLVSRFEGVNVDRFGKEMERVRKFYDDLPSKNPDGKTGMNFVKIDLDPVAGDDTKAAWQTNLAKFRPERWRGVVHWMQVTPGGGGQADELGDGGTCGEGALWAVFTHEFGHQLGLNHEGFWPNGSCPIYSSMMNYNYSYGYEDSYDKIHYSDGRFAGYTLREDDLDETIPLPYDQVKFLSMGPYHYRLKPGPDGKSTLIDWNWNGIFGEKHIRADVNYAYSTNAGLRDTMGKTSVAPWLVVHKKEAYAIYANTDAARTPGGDPTLSPIRPGRLFMRRLLKPFKWGDPWNIAEDVIGDPVAASVGSHLVVAYAKAQGVVTRHLLPRDGAAGREDVVGAPGLVPTVGEAQGRPMLMLWNPADGSITVRTLTEKNPGEPIVLDAKSANPPGMCTDTKTGETILALAQNQDAARPNRWQIRRFDRNWKETGMDWVEGPTGGARGTGRLTVLFDAGRDAGPKGRVLIFGKGMTDAKTPWSCTYVAQTIADKTVHGGWLVKRYYDEWTQSRSAPAAAWFDGDVIWAYRWVGGDGPSDDDMQVGYRALGIQSEPFGDFDDIGFIRNFGMQRCLLTLGKG